MRRASQQTCYQQMHCHQVAQRMTTPVPVMKMTMKMTTMVRVYSSATPFLTTLKMMTHRLMNHCRTRLKGRRLQSTDQQELSLLKRCRSRTLCCQISCTNGQRSKLWAVKMLILFCSALQPHRNFNFIAIVSQERIPPQMWARSLCNKLSFPLQQFLLPSMPTTTNCYRTVTATVHSANKSPCCITHGMSCILVLRCRRCAFGWNTCLHPVISFWFGQGRLI